MIDSEGGANKTKEGIGIGGVFPEKVIIDEKIVLGNEQVVPMRVMVGRGFGGESLFAEYYAVVEKPGGLDSLQVCVIDSDGNLPEVTGSDPGFLISKGNFDQVNKMLAGTGKLKLPEQMIAAGSTEPNTTVEVVADNGVFFSMVKLTTGGEDHLLIMNREADGRKGGYVNVVILPSGNIVLTYTTSLWGVRPELPRSFANKNGPGLRLREETGIRGGIEIVRSIMVGEDPRFMGSKICVNIVEPSENKMGERVINGGVSFQWVMEMTKIGMIRDGYTIGAVLIAGLSNNKIVVNPERREMLTKKIVFEEKIMTQWGGERYLFLPRGKRDDGIELGKVISNSGISNIEYSPRVLNLDQVAGLGEKRLVGVSIEKVLEMIKMGKLDMVTTAALAQYFYNEGIVLCKEQQKKFSRD